MAQKVNDFSYKSQNEAMKTAIKNSINKLFPIVNKNKELVIKNIKVIDELNDTDFPVQREIKLNRKTWQMPVVADFELIDKDTGHILDKMTSKKIGNLPKITNRYTTLIDGNEYQTANQFRRKSGVYSRIKKNGELEAEFNLSKGKNFKMMMDPVTGVFYLLFANRKYRVWTLLNTLGVKEESFIKIWGKDILERNKKNAYNTEESELKAIYNIVYNKQPKTLEEAQTGLIRYFTEGTEMSGDVNKLTLGEGFTKVNSESLLATSKKLLNINKGKDVPDERDSLVFKDFYTIDDLVTSYFNKNSKVLKSKLERNLGLRERIKEVVTPSTFSDPVKRFFTVGDLASTPPQTNPITILSETRKTTPMGTGGIESSHAVTVDMRNLHPSHLGFLDGTATPECLNFDSEILTSKGFKYVTDVTYNDKVACKINGALEFHTPNKVFKHKYTGKMYGYKNTRINYLVSEGHKVWAKKYYTKNAEYERLDIKDTYGKRIIHDITPGVYKGENQKTFILPGTKLKIDINDWSEFIGWFISEGCVMNKKGYTSMRISQNKLNNSFKWNQLNSLLSRFPIEFKYHGHDFTNSKNKELHKYLQLCGKYAANKTIPEFYQHISIEARERLVIGLMAGDGRRVDPRNPNKGNNIKFDQDVYTTGSAQLAKDVERLLIGLGYAVSVNSYEDKRKDRYLDIYEIRILDFKEAQTRNTDGYFTEENTHGYVYSVQVPGSIVYTRRQGSWAHWTGNSGKVGVTLGLASEINKQGKNLHTPVRDLNNKLHWFSPLQMYENTIGFPDQFKLNKNRDKLIPISDIVKVMKKNKTEEVPASEVKYYLRSPKTMFAIQTNLMPFLANTQGNRVGTGARMITQALPLVNPDTPIIETQRDALTTYEQLAGHSLGPNSDVDGVVNKIDEDYIYVKDKTNKEHKYGMYKDFPLNQDGFVNSYPIVKVGQHIKKGDLLAGNNYTRGDKIALSKNLNVGFLSYKGLNFEDGVVLTESAAKKLTHQTIHRENIYFSPKLTVFDKAKFNAWYPDEISQSNYNKLNATGIIGKGQRVVQGDVIAAYLVEKEMNDLDNALKKLDKITFNKYEKKILTWDNEDSGVVTDVKKIGRNIDIYIKAEHPLKEGDKISSYWGNKGIVTAVIPDDEAPHRPNGEPLDIMMSAEGVPGRMNIGQIHAMAASKIAEKTGKPYLVNNFADPNHDATKTLVDKAKELNIEFDEVLTDGKNGKKLIKPVFVGKQPIIKLRHIIDKKLGAHSIGVYDIYEQPAGKGAQKAGALDVYGYLAHGAKNNLEEMATIKGRKNEEYWRDLQFGLPPGKPARNFVWDKMIADLKGMGVNVDKNGHKIRIMPMTDKDVMSMSNGEIKDPGTLLIGKNLLAKKGGLFDKEITGGAKGTNWSHFNLAVRLPNPMFEDAIIKLLDLTEKKYSDIIDGKVKLNGKTGPEAIVAALKNIDVKKTLKFKKDELKNAPPTNVNKLNTTVKYLQALSNLKMEASDAYTISKLPVTPPQFRPIYPLPSGDLMISDINKHYKDIGVVNNGLKANLKNGNLTKEKELESQATLYNTVKALQGIIDPVTYSKQKYKGFLKEFGKVKTGTVHGRAWSKSQDLSGRSTITIEPDLSIDEVGLPADMAYKMWKPLIIKELKSYGLKASESKKQYTDKTALAKKALTQVAENHPVIINRAPSLHKHSIQAFNPVLVDGKSIKLNPMIFSGFNADLDGDTMSVMTPIGKQAIEEAKDIMPSKILFKHGDNALVPELSKDYIYGLYQASRLGADTGKSFKTISEAKKAKVKMTDVFTIKGKKMTLGQYYINKPLPESLKDYSREMSKKNTQKLLSTLGKSYPSYFSEVISTWKDIGFNYAHIFGHTISINDFNMNKSYRNDLYKKELPKIKKLKGEAKIKAYNNLTLKIQDAQNKLLKKSKNNLKDMINSGSFSKKDSVRQILSLPGVLNDIKGNPISVPVLKSWGEGIDAASFFNSLYAVRKGTVDRAVNTQETGAVTKSLLNVGRRTTIVEEDCNTNKYLTFDIDSKDVLDRFAAVSVPGVVQRNQLIDTEVLNKARIKRIKSLNVRSPLTCEAVNGICQKCYGLLPSGKEAPIGTNVGILDGHALTERSTQLTMQTFHCYHGGSLIQTENGELRLIKDLHDENYRGKILDNNGEFTEVIGSSKHLVTEKMQILMSKNRRQLIAQGNHPVQVKTNDYKCYYCDSVQVSKHGKDKYFCQNCFTKFDADKLIHTNEVVTKEIKDINKWDESLIRSPFKANFGSEKWDWEITPVELGHYISDPIGFELNVNDDTMTRLKKDCGDRWFERHLPPKILLYDKRDVMDVVITVYTDLGKFFVNKRWEKRKHNIGNVYLFTTNYNLANQLPIVLQKLGLMSSLTVYSQKRPLNKYLVRIHNIKKPLWNAIAELRTMINNPLKHIVNFSERNNYVSRIKAFFHNTSEDQYVYDLETKSETLSVNEIWAHNSGGSAVAGGGALEGFPNIKRLLQVPDKLGNKSTLALNNGIVERISKNSVGGYDIYINGVNHISLPGQLPLVKVGDVIEKGDQLSSGIIKPQELGTLKSHLDAQKYIVGEMNKVFKDKFNKKTFETIVRSVSDNAEITEAPEDVDFIRGDKTTISYVDNLNKFRKKEGLDLIKYKPYFKSIETSNVDNSDWLTKVTTNRIKAAIRTGAAKGQYTNLKGKDPIPAYIYGDDFAENTK